MSARQSLLFKLQDAKRARAVAEERCVHWNQECSGDGHECCRDLQVAEGNVRRAREALRKAEGIV
ncbi:MAG TPA: hypothetical protein VGG49_13255 [Steroidobacteraceae bacterium]|jgi:hypothetical protein